MLRRFRGRITAPLYGRYLAISNYLNVHQFVRVWLAPTSVVDIVTVQKLAGYASPLTTSKYDRRGEEVKRQALQKLRLRD